jgi:hypothetical protein
METSSHEVSILMHHNNENEELKHQLHILRLKNAELRQEVAKGKRDY